MDEKVLEEIKFHTDTIEADANSPLHLIREKEMEISGRVLAAKKEAETIVAAARKKAVDVVDKAEAEGARLAAEQEARIMAEVEVEVAKIGEESEAEVAELATLVSDRMDKAVEFVVETVTGT